MQGLLLHELIELCTHYSWPTKEIHVVKLCNSLTKWKHTMIVSYYVNLIIILISYPILSWNLVTQMWNIIVKYPGTFQYTVCRNHYETIKKRQKQNHLRKPWLCQGNNMILHTSLHCLKQNINQEFKFTKAIPYKVLYILFWILGLRISHCLTARQVKTVS